MHRAKSAELETFNDCMNNMHRLYEIKMGIPLEEVNSIKANLKHMKEKVGRLQETKDSKLDTYNKYCEDCVRSREEK